MSSTNEPGRPRSSDGSGAAGSPAAGSSEAASGSGPDGGSLGTSEKRSGSPQTGPAPGVDHGEVPPWQRGPATRAKAHQQSSEAPSHADDSRAAGLDARLNRFIAGAPAAPEPGSATRGERAGGPRTEGPGTEAARTEGARAEATRPDGSSAAYRSELPDLSDAPPRAQQQRKPPDRPAAEQTPKPPAQAPAPGRAVQVAVRQHTGPVRASMQIRRIDPWSALKVSLVLSVAMFFVWMIAVAFLYLVLGGMGVWSKLNSNVGDLLTSTGGSAGGELVSSGTVFGGAALIGLVNIVLLTAAATIGVFIYNLTTDLVGGVEVTLADRD